MAQKQPPRFVPTLTEVVHSGPAPLAPSMPSPPALSADQLAQRVLQRVDLVLDRRLREAIATLVLEQTSQLAPLLRERVEAAVREVVADAVAEEIQARQRGADSGV
jgi:dsDNA-binding SOS-regulon protein